MSAYFPLRCGRFDDHPEHDWSAPRDPGCSARIWHCNGHVVTTLAEKQWSDRADFDEKRDDELREFWREGMTS